VKDLTSYSFDVEFSTRQNLDVYDKNAITMLPLSILSTNMNENILIYGGNN